MTCIKMIIESSIRIEKVDCKEMIPFGNYICAGFVLVETLLVNGMFTGWGMMSTLFKNDDIFPGILEV